MKKTLLLLASITLLAACNRVPTGILSLADGSEAAPRSVSGGSGVQAERDLRRLEDIDKSIQASLTRLDAALDPNNKTPANLDKLVQGDKTDPSLLSNRNLRQQAQVDAKFDEKNQALIDNSLSGNLDDLDSTRQPDAADAPTRQQRLLNQIDNRLDDKAGEVLAEPDASTETVPAESAPAEQAPESAPAPEAPEPAPEVENKPSL